MKDFQILTTRGDVMELIEYHNKSSEYVVLDVETTSKDPRKAELIDIQLSGYTEDTPCLFAAEFKDELTRIKPPIVAHNYKYDFHVLHRHGVDLTEREVWDTTLMHHLYDENVSHSLGDIVFGIWGDNYKEEFWGKYGEYSEADITERQRYACLDIYYTGALFTFLRQALDAMGIPASLVSGIHRFSRSLLRTELSGVLVDTEYLNAKGIELLCKINALIPEMRALCRHEIETIEGDLWAKELDKRKTLKGRLNVPRVDFSFDSASQVQRLLYGELRLPVQLHNRTKRPSVDDDCLETLSKLHPVVPMLREYRALTKIHGTYILGISNRLEGGRIYPSFNINGTVTGRISSSNPNLQNMPKEGDIRGIFVPDPGYVLVSCDYSQLEVRIAAHYSRDENLLRIIEEGVSQHDITAQSLGIPRDKAKTLNFAEQYQCTAYKVAQILGVSKKRAEEVHNKYWETYAGLKRTIDECAAQVDLGIPIVTAYGRQRRFEVKKREAWDKAYRQAFNAKIQGTGADLTSLAFTATDLALRQAGIGFGLFPIHDEILAQVKKEYAEAGIEIVKNCMISVWEELNFSVPIEVSCSKPMARWVK